MNGAELAAAELNSQGPLKVKILAQDDRFDGKHALSAYRKLTHIDKIDALITASSITIDVLYPQLIRSGIPTVQLAEMGTEPVADNVFQISEEFMICGDALAAELNPLDPKKAVVVSASIRAYDRFFDRFAATAKFPIERISFDPSEATLSSIIPRIVSLNPSHLVLMMGPQHAGEIVKLYRVQQRHQTPIYFEEDLLVDIDGLKSQLPDLSVIHNDKVAIIDRSTDPQFVANYRKRFAEAPEYGEYGYDAVMALAKLYSPDRKEWLAKFHSADITGATGQISFDSRGVRVGKTKVVTVKEALEMRAK